MATLLLFPFPSLGHINPALKLGKNLMRAGHRVCYIGFAEFQEYFCSQIVEFIPILEAGPGEGSRRVQPSPMRAGVVSQALAAVEKAERTNSDHFKQIERELERIVRIVEPDLLIVDFLIGGLAYKAAREFGVASALLSASHFEMPMMGKPLDDPEHLKLPVLVLCPDEFEFPNAIVRKPNRYYIEPSVDLQRKQIDTFPWEKLDASKRLIYCSLGGHPQYYSQSSTLYLAVIEAMKYKLDWQLVLGIGDMSCDAFQRIPENVLVLNWPPQLELLRRASIMISHGGLGSIKECILLGVPMILFPSSRFDHPFNAARVVAHGLGVRGNINHVSALQIVSLIEALEKDPSFKRRVESMSKTFNAIENSGIGVSVVNHLLSQRRAGDHLALGLSKNGV